MPFIYKQYKIERLDPYNVCLFEYKPIEVAIKGKKTGETRLDYVRQGYYNSFTSCLKQMVSRLMEDCELVSDLREILDRVEALRIIETD